jgi:hypothetical protein
VVPFEASRAGGQIRAEARGGIKITPGLEHSLRPGRGRAEFRRVLTGSRAAVVWSSRTQIIRPRAASITPSA